MGAFIDAAADELVELDREYCPPRPDGTHYHEHDTVNVRTDWGYADVLAIDKMGRATPSLIWDAEMATLALLERAITAWTFVNDKGEPVPVGMPTIRLLAHEIGDKVSQVADQHFTAAQKQLPNPSGAPSQPSSPERLSALAQKTTRRSNKRSTPRSN